MTAVSPSDVDVETPTERRPGLARRFLRNPLASGSLVLVAIVVALGILAPLISAHGPNFSSLDAVNLPPGSPDYLLGGDSSGRDILARLLASIATAMISAIIGVVVATVVGVAFGLIAGYNGVRLDSVVSWIFNLLMTFPALVLVIVLFPITGGSYQVTMAIFGFLFSPGIYRLVRNQVVAVKNELYVDAAKVSGLSTSRILVRHVFGAVRGPVVIAASFLAGAGIAVQSGLAFLGLGSNEVPSFGAMTADAFVNIYSQPIQFVWPSIMLAILSGGFVLIGNGLRDAFGGQNAKPTKRRQASVEAPAAAPRAEDVDPDALLVLRNLRISYPKPDGDLKPVVNGIDLTVRPGEILGLVGESGSGKTQTAFAMLGLLPPEAVIEADEITLDGQSLIGLGVEQMRRLRGTTISYVPQEPMSNLDPSFTIGSQLVEGIRAATGVSRAEARATALDLLARVGIPDPARTFRSYPHQISGGMAQRVLIAGAVATRPKLLIADEPTTALDVTVQAEILDLLRGLQRDYRMGIILVTHNFGVVADLCDRVAVMQTGEVVETGPYRELYREARHPYTQKLLGAILDENTYRSDLSVELADAGKAVR